MQSGELIIRLQLNEKTLRQLYKEEEEKKKKTLSEGLTKKLINRPTKEVRNNKYLPLAKQLSKTIQTKKNVKHSLPQIKQWADEIRRLKEQSGIEYDRIEKVLDWYETNIGGEYIPVIESGYSLRSKFIRLEDAMKRIPISNKPKFIYDPDQGRFDLAEDGKYRHCTSGVVRIP